MKDGNYVSRTSPLESALQVDGSMMLFDPAIICKRTVSKLTQSQNSIVYNLFSSQALYHPPASFNNLSLSPSDSPLLFTASSNDYDLRAGQGETQSEELTQVPMIDVQTAKRAEQGMSKSQRKIKRHVFPKTSL